jgi:hypothetical protein
LIKCVRSHSLQSPAPLFLCGSSWSLQGAVRIESTGKNGDAKVAERDNEDRRPQGRNADVNSKSNRDV